MSYLAEAFEENSYLQVEASAERKIMQTKPFRMRHQPLVYCESFPFLANTATLLVDAGDHFREGRKEGREGGREEGSRRSLYTPKLMHTQSVAAVPTCVTFVPLSLSLSPSNIQH